MSSPISIPVAILELFPLGVLLVTAQGRVVHMNTAAKEILKRNPTFAVTEGKLQAMSASYGRALSNGIRKCLSSSTSYLTGFSIARQNMPLITVSVLPLPSPHNSRNAAAPRLLILISDPAHNIRGDADLLASLFEFTRAEASVALQLIDGKDVADIARNLRISTHTVRNHIKRLLSKTNTNRMCDFVRLLLRSPAGLALGDPAEEQNSTLDKMYEHGKAAG